MDLDALKRLDQRYQRQATKSEALRLERNQAIRELVDSGVRMSDIARTLNVTRARIAQIYRQPS
jgi:DNA-binding NarL/FixJ family response regulator